MDNIKKEYEIKNEIGEGQFGKVYKVLNIKTGEYYAMKKMDKNINESESINNEISNLKIISSRNSIKFIKCFEDNNYFYLITDLYDDNLASLIKKSKKGFSKNKIKSILNNLNTCFTIMNQNKIIHRDIKPENIFIKYTSNNKKTYKVYVGDFGFSRDLDSSIYSLNYTFNYCAPEILNNASYVYNEKCDLYALGVMIYEMKYKYLPVDNFKNFDIPKKFEDDPLLYDLVSKLICKEEDRLNWEGYLNHPYFDVIEDDDNIINKETINFESVKKVTENKSAVKCGMVLNDGRIICGTEDASIKIFSYPDFKLVDSYKAIYHVWQIIQLSDNNLLCGEDNGMIEVINFKDKTLKHKAIINNNICSCVNKQPIWSVIQLKNQSSLKHNGKIVTCSHNCLKIWNLDSNNKLIMEKFLFQCKNDYLESVFELPNGNIVTTSDDSLCKFYKKQTFELIVVLENIGCCSRTGFAMINNNCLAIASRYDKIINIIDIINYKVKKKYYFSNDVICLLNIIDYNLLFVGEQNTNKIAVIDNKKNEIICQSKSLYIKSSKGPNAIVRINNNYLITFNYDHTIEIYKFYF